AHLYPLLFIALALHDALPISDVAFLRAISDGCRRPIFLCESSSANLAFYLDSPNVRWLGDPPDLRGISRLPAGPGAIVLSQAARSEEHTSELQSPDHLVCRLL